MTEQLAQPAEAVFRSATPADSLDVAQAFLESSRGSYTETAAENQLGADWITAQMAQMSKKYGEDYWRDLITATEKADSDQLFLVASSPGKDKIDGLMYVKRQAGSLLLDALYLVPAAQGKQLGAEFVARAEAFAGSLPIELEVMDKNKRAIRFYEKLGFKRASDTFTRTPASAAVFLMRKENLAKEAP